MKKNKKINTKRLAIKLFLSAIYLVIITILLVGSYKIFKDKNKITSWNQVKSSDEYSYIEISKMSEKFAYYENENIGLHFVIEEEETGLWHTYVIAINEDNLSKYKDIIDYTYGNSSIEPNKITVYGYPSIMSDELKDMILHNIGNFLPESSGVELTKDNIDIYLTNSYLDTTKEKTEDFDTTLFITLLLLFIMIALQIFTILDKDKVVDDIESRLEKLDELTDKAKYKKRRK